ncbi:MAG: hypothetical protein ABI338_05510 [Gemmatimonadaceae bacterium]
MLTSIPIISPIEVTLGEPGVRRLPPPDYEVQALPAAAALTSGEAREPAIVALDEIERTAQISEYHDFSWWDERVRLIRARIGTKD